jgi:putative transposase
MKPESRFRHTPGGVSALGLHVVWCPKYRRQILRGRVAARLDQLLTEIAAERGWNIVAKEVMPDHVHVFVRVGPSDSPAEVARQFKGRTSQVLRSEFPWLARQRVLWSKSYFAASVGYVSESTVRHYIEHQWDGKMPTDLHVRA